MIKCNFYCKSVLKLLYSIVKFYGNKSIPQKSHKAIVIKMQIFMQDWGCKFKFLDFSKTFFFSSYKKLNFKKSTSIRINTCKILLLAESSLSYYNHLLNTKFYCIIIDHYYIVKLVLSNL